MKPGFNAMIVDQDWKVDPSAVMKAAAGLGFRGMEVGIPDSAEKAGSLRSMLEGVGLTPVTGFTSFDVLRERPGAVAEAAARLGVRYVTIGWSPFDSLEYIDRAVGWCSEYGGLLKQEGITLLYHNHDHELKLFGGRPGLELLYERTDPDCLQAHPDTYWLAKAGQDPVAWLKKMRGRCPLLHLKDMDASGGFCELGGGTLDLDAICRQAGDSGTEWIDYEQDMPGRLSPWECMRASAREMERIGLI